ncbi:MAG: peptidylprolyl isomerase [Coriobacteriia bacterium]|nr:peptidylprolyl isomerase [Coriobacteriia bacterium]
MSDKSDTKKTDEKPAKEKTSVPEKAKFEVKMAEVEAEGFIDMIKRPVVLVVLGIALAAVVAGVVFLLLSCGSEGKAAAEVNGEAITERQLNAEMARIEFQSPGIFDVEQGGYDRAMIRAQRLDDLINEELLLQEARRVGVEVTDEEIDERFEELKAMYGDNYEQEIRGAGYTEQDIRTYFMHALYIQGLLDQRVSEDEITEAEIQEFYNSEEAALDPEITKPAATKGSHILIMTDDEDRTDEESRELIEDILAQLEAGADFAELAEEYSEDPGSAAVGGDLGWIEDTSRFVPEFAETFDRLGVGEISGVVETQFGYHIVMITDKRSMTKESLDEVSDYIREILYNDLQRTRAQELLDELREQATIVIFDAEVLRFNEEQEAESSEVMGMMGDGEGVTIETE